MSTNTPGFKLQLFIFLIAALCMVLFYEPIELIDTGKLFIKLVVVYHLLYFPAMIAWGSLQIWIAEGLRKRKYGP